MRNTIIILTFLMLFLSGCMTQTHSGSPELSNKKKILSIKNRVTTKQDIIKMFGEPSGINVTENKVQWSYVDVKTEKSFFSIINVFFISPKVEAYSLTVVFDSKTDIVIEYGFSKS